MTSVLPDILMPRPFMDGYKDDAAMKEIWVAARAGGFHYRMAADQRWIDTRDGSELFAALSRLASAQAGALLHVKQNEEGAQ